jgi:midasin (ATPase involved in ribosome maturation)
MEFNLCRYNSVLEPGRTLTLPEKGGSEVEELVAHPNFLLLATMNPGGAVQVDSSLPIARKPPGFIQPLDL